MSEYSKLIDSVVSSILKREISSLSKKITAQELNKRNNSLQIVINREFDFVQSILENCDISKKEKNRLTKKILKMYVSESQKGNKINSKIIKQIRKEMINEIENSEIAELEKKPKINFAEMVKKAEFESKIDKMMQGQKETTNMAIEKSATQKAKSIAGVTSLKQNIATPMVANIKQAAKVEKAANVMKSKKVKKVEETSTALIIKEDKFINRLKRFANEFVRKVNTAFTKSKMEPSKIQAAKPEESLLSKNTGSTNAFIKRVYVDMKKVNKIASGNMSLNIAGQNLKK